MYKALGVLGFAFAVLSMVWPPASASARCVRARPAAEINTGADQPSDIDLAPNGDVYLVDGVNHRVMVFDPKGKPKFTFGSLGTDPGRFRYPLGIDISADGMVFIADTGNRRIQIFDLQGGVQGGFEVAASIGTKPPDPVDVLASPLKDYVYVTDNDNHRVHVYTRSGRLVLNWGGFGEGPGQFRYPAMLAINPFNEILVVDVLNTRVQKFDPFGNFIAEIGGWGIVPGKLFRPKGVAVDTANRVMVSDSYTGVVQQYTDAGEFLGVLCDGDQHQKFRTPVGLALDDQHRRLHVVQMRANKIQILDLSE